MEFKTFEKERKRKHEISITKDSVGKFHLLVGGSEFMTSFSIMEIGCMVDLIKSGYIKF